LLLLVGLGNPGDKYTNTRHNVGFMMADEIARHHGFSPWRNKFQGLICDGMVGGEKILLLKPQTFMNRSGQSVSEACRFYKLGTENLIVFHDELDLAAGKLRIKTGGGHGGNNGIRDITAHMDANFKRVRMGVGRPQTKEQVSNHLLSDFAKSDNTWLEPMIDECVRSLPLLLKSEDANYMTRVAERLKPNRPNKLKQSENKEG
jgi:PTH1 family peptidyl-tRNA hydrolase